MNEQLQELLKQESIIDTIIAGLQSELTDMAGDPAYAQFAYLTQQDISMLGAAYGMGVNGDTFIAVKGPIGT